MMKRFLLLTTFAFLLSGSLNLHGEVTGYVHEKTDIIFPSEIEGLILGEKHMYDKSALGESIPYNGEGVAATIYIYNYNRADLRDDAEHSLINRELGNALGDIRAMEKRGVYAKVKLPDTGVLREEKDHFSLMLIPVTYDQVKNTRTGEPIDPQSRSSLIGVGIYKGYFIKLRYSLEIGEDLEEKVKQREVFIDSLMSLIREVKIRPVIKEYLSIYLKAPLSEEGREALGGIMAYSEKSHLVTMRIHYGVAPWLNEEDYPYSYELLGAYMAGQVQYQLGTNDFRSNEQAGTEQVQKVYELLKAKHNNAVLEIMEEGVNPDEQP